MNGKHGNQENGNHGQTRERDESAQQHGEPTGNLDQRGKPCHEMRGRYADGMQEDGEGIRASE
jgi:hypothetical protein